MNRIFYFILGCAIAVSAIFWVKFPKAERFASLGGDGARLGELDHRIEMNPKPIDIAFFGSSHTATGVADKMIEGLLGATGTPFSIVNFGTFYMGRDLQLFELKRLLSRRKPRLVVIEVTEHEYEFGHEHLPYIGDPSDLFCCKFYLDPYFPKHIALYLKLQATHALQDATGNAPSLAPVDTWDHGWRPYMRQWSLAEYAAAMGPPGRWGGLKERIHAKASAYGLDVVRRMLAEARAKNVRVAFLYLPSIRYIGRKTPVGRDEYTPFGPVIDFPLALRDEPGIWYDEAHLNQQGAEKLAPFIADGLRNLLAQASPNQ